MKALVIGDKDVVLGFQLVGIKGMAVSNKEEAVDALKTAVDIDDIRIIFITEDFSTQIYDEIASLRHKLGAPLIVDIPSRSGIPGESLSTQKLLQKMMRSRV